MKPFTQEIQNLLVLLKDPMIKKEIRQIAKTALGANITTEKHNRTIANPTGLYVNTCDLKILALVFKWKIVPMFVMKAQLLREEKEKTFEKRVERLVRRGLLKRVSHLGVLSFYQMTESGFLRFKQGLDGFKEEGFASENIGHDFLSLALQLGPWVTVKPKNIEIVTEQEMRRFYANELPSWLPKIDSHRPDGFTRFKRNKGSYLIAFEVEISPKTSERYGPVFQYYNSNSNIDLVVWLVKNKTLKDLLIENILRVDERNLKKHAFILLEDFKSFFLEAMVESGQKPLLSYVELMSRTCRTDVAEVSLGCRNTPLSDFLKYLAKH